MKQPLETAIARLKLAAPGPGENAGQNADALVAVTDDAAAQPSTYLVAPAAGIGELQVLTMVNFAGGVICAAISESRISELGIPPMAPLVERAAAQFLVSVEARHGVTTGISAADRARTLRVLAETSQPRRELVTPGHIFPLRAKSGGVLVKNAIAEAAVDLMALAGCPPTAAICRCLDKEGNLLGKDSAAALAEKLGVPIISITDIIEHRLANESIIEKIAEAKLPIMDAGLFKACCFRSLTDGAEHLALLKGDLSEAGDDNLQKPVLVRVQAERGLGDLFDLNGTANRAQILTALQKIDAAGRGVFVYIRHPGKSISDRLNTASSPQGPASTPASALREFGIGAQILNQVGANRVVLLSRSGRDIVGADAFNLEIIGHESF